MDVYLNFAGNCREAFEFYRSVFGGEFTVVQTFGDAPQQAQMPEGLADRIMHIRLPLGASLLMGSDVFDDAEHFVGSNVQLSLAPESREACDRLFAALSDGGEVESAPQEMFWGAYFASCRDRFGIRWMLNHELD
ncbi:MAG: VOC family protein [Pseudomonadota bacterium]